jgi:hypothetical protein
MWHVFVDHGRFQVSALLYLRVVGGGAGVAYLAERSDDSPFYRHSELTMLKANEDLTAISQFALI